MCALHCGGIYFGRTNYEERLQDDSKIVRLGGRGVKKSATFDIVHQAQQAEDDHGSNIWRMARL
jgi:hypothetical protein